MKKKCYVFCVLIISMLLFLQTTVHATNYKVYGTDLTVNLDDTEWYVFTRDNIENNDELASVGLSYEYMYDVLYNNMAYMNACLFYEDGSFLEFFIRKTDISDIVNLSNYDSDELQLLAEKLANRAGSEKYNIYESEYKYVKLEYVDSVSDVSLNICEYLTVVNGDSYTFTFQGNNDFSSSDYSEMKNIIDSIKFRVDESLDEPILSSVDDSKSSIFDGVLEKAIGGVVVALVFIATPFLYKLGKKRKMETIEKGKVYYGLFGCRILGLFILSVMISEMVLLLILGDSVDGTPALILMIFVAALLTGLFTFLYKNIFEKRLNKKKTIDVSDDEFNKKESRVVQTEIFSQTEKITIDDMSKRAMVISIDFVGELKNFYDIDDKRAIAVNLGYFYGFLKMQLNSISGLDVADKVIERAINHTENALEGTVEFEGLALMIKELSSKSIDNMHYATKEFKDKPFTAMALCYLADLSNSKTVSVNEERVDIAEENVRKLYGITSSITKNIKIVK